MSMRARRINKIDYAESPTFNMWNDEAVTNWLSGGGYLESLNAGGGIFEIAHEDLSEMVSELGEKIDPAVKKSLEKDIQWAKKNDREHIMYDCF